QFVERLFRQNMHTTVSTIVGMPMDTALRIRLGLVSNGHVRPLAVLLASAGILFTAGELAPPGWRLHWTSLYWPVAALSLLLALLMLYVRVRYPDEIRASLHARRL